MVSLTASLMLSSVSAVQLPLAAFVVTQGYWPSAAVTAVTSVTAVTAVTAVKARKTKEMRCMVSFVGVGRGVSVLIAAKRTNSLSKFLKQFLRSFPFPSTFCFPIFCNEAKSLGTRFAWVEY